jgi:hypothetical protein
LRATMLETACHEAGEGVYTAQLAMGLECGAL